MRIPKKLAAVAVAGLAGVMATSAAYAFWSTAGSGTGSASTTNGVNGELSFTQSALNAMYPGDSAQTFTVDVKNTDANEKVYVAHVKAYVTTDQDSDCDGSNFLLNGLAAPSSAATAVDLGWTAREISVGAQYSTSGLDSIQFNDKNSNQDDCKNAVVTLHYLAS